MPIITVDGPRVADVAKKREFVKKVTDAAADLFSDIPRDAIVVILKENVPENVAVGGELVCDRRGR